MNSCFKNSRRLASVVLAAPVISLVLLSFTGAYADDLSKGNDLAASGSLALASPQFSLAGSSLRMLGALLLCLGVFALGLKIAARIKGESFTPKRRRLEVRERLSIAPKISVTLIALDNREYLLASGANSVTLVSTNSLTTPLFADSLDQVLDDVGSNDG
jgi:flagellar biogenesis protein FliO